MSRDIACKRESTKPNIDWGNEWQNIAIHRGASTLRGIRILLPPLRTNASDILKTTSLRNYLFPISGMRNALEYFINGSSNNMERITPYRF
jgi:hypothetical protein